VDHAVDHGPPGEIQPEGGFGRWNPLTPSMKDEKEITKSVKYVIR